MGYYYLSNPYNGSDDQKEFRAKAAAHVCGTFIKNDIFVVSPIAHNHAMMREFQNFTLEERRTKILEFDFALLKSAQGMIVLQLDGWDSSYGVTKEIEFCQRHNIPIEYLDPQNLEDSIEAMRSTLFYT